MYVVIFDFFMRWGLPINSGQTHSIYFDSLSFCCLGSIFFLHCLLFRVEERSSPEWPPRTRPQSARRPKKVALILSHLSQVRKLRLPKRIDNHRGFAFVEYVTKQETENAMQALASTHLYGRRLVSASPHISGRRRRQKAVELRWPPPVGSPCRS